jgi:hypothetical protein
MLILALSLLQTFCRYFKGKEKISQFITASSSSHFQSSLQLLTSIFHHEVDPVVTYVDLGLRRSEILQIKTKFPNVEIVSFPFESFPVWFNMAEDAGKFAWKANSIDLFHHDSAEIIVWLDAGCKLTGKLRLVKSIAAKNGFFILPANGSVGSLTHPDSVKSLQFENSAHLSMLSAAFIALDLSNRSTSGILNAWVAISNVREIIAPPDSNWFNHRYDQSIVSMLIHKNEDPHITNYRKLPSRFFGFLIHQDVESLK